MAVKYTARLQLWVCPEFQKLPRQQTEMTAPAMEVMDDDPEIKKEVCVMSTKVVITCDVLDVLEKRISRWSKMVRVLVYVDKFIARCKHIEVSLSIETSDIAKAEDKLISLIQQRSYHNEIEIYRTLPERSNKKIKTCLWWLNPLLDESGILRVGGRLGKTSLGSNIKHLAILPCDVIATRRIAQSCHRAVRTTTVGDIQDSVRILDCQY